MKPTPKAIAIFCCIAIVGLMVIFGFMMLVIGAFGSILLAFSSNVAQETRYLLWTVTAAGLSLFGGGLYLVKRFNLED